MVNVLATAAALVVVALFGAALLALSAGNLQVAGFSFLAASLVIYLRETRLVGN
jgi:uncharacterized membrane protein